MSFKSKDTAVSKDTRLELFLKGLELDKYLEVFQNEEVSYRILTEMEEKDLQDLGIPFGNHHNSDSINSKVLDDQCLKQLTP
jgi:hypothetical protein